MPDCTLPLRSSRPIQSEVINQISMRPNQRWARFPTRLMRQEEMGGSPSQELPERSAAIFVQPWPLYAHGGAESLHCFITFTNCTHPLHNSHSITHQNTYIHTTLCTSKLFYSSRTSISIPSTHTHQTHSNINYNLQNQTHTSIQSEEE